MKLGEFIDTFIEHNSLIRVVHKDKSGYLIANKSWEDISMEWEVKKRKGVNRHYINNEVFGIASIHTGGHYPETINIVIEKLAEQPIIDEAPAMIVTQSERKEYTKYITQK